MRTITQSMLTIPADFHVCPVNTVPGVMGAGVAKLFADEIPGLGAQHALACKAGLLDIGKVYVVEGVKPRSAPIANVILFPTKAHWRNPARKEYVTAGLSDLAGWIAERLTPPTPDAYPISIIMPALGCGLGGLPFEMVEALVARWAATAVPDHVDITICKPQRKEQR